MPAITACARTLEHIGNDYRRVRIGVGHPGDEEIDGTLRVAGFCQGRGGPGWKRCATSSPTAAGLLVEGKDSTFQNKLHLAMAAKGFIDDKDEPAVK